MQLTTLAKRLNLDVEKLQRGETIKTIISVPTPEKYKELFGPATPPAKSALAVAARSCALSGENPDSYEAGLKHFTAYVAGLCPLDTSIGSVFFAKRFPLRVSVLAAQDLTLTTDTIQGPNAGPYTVICNNLTFNGGSFVIYNTAFTLWVTGTLTITNAQGDRPYHIGILGYNGSPGGDGTIGGTQAQAAAGADAPTPAPGVCTGAGSGKDGTTGAQGLVGTNGGNGGDGAPSLAATINIAAFNTPQATLQILGTTGNGGNGGNGGQGGPGQQGGNGGAGCSSGCEGTDGGNGATGGKGGTGGNGGNGGNSPNGGVISLNLPSSQQTGLYNYTSQGGTGGTSGNGGAAGLAGPGGSGGSGGHGSADGNAGAAGGVGAAGNSGNPGANGSAPNLVPGTYSAPSSN